MEEGAGDPMKRCAPTKLLWNMLVRGAFMANRPAMYTITVGGTIAGEV